MLAYALPYRRFADTLAGASARLGADAVRYSLPVSPAHQNTQFFNVGRKPALGEDLTRSGALTLRANCPTRR